MNQPSENIPISIDTTIPPNRVQSGSVGTIPNSPLSNLFARLKKSARDRKGSKGAFGGKARSARHAGLV